MRRLLLFLVILSWGYRVPAQMGCLMGTVVDENGKPFADALITAVPRDHSTPGFGLSPWINGSFKAALAAGLYDIHIKPGYHASRQRKFNPDTPIEVSIPASAFCVSVQLELVQAASLVMKGRNAATGEPLEEHPGELEMLFGPSFNSSTRKVLAPGKVLDVSSRAEVDVRIGMPGYEQTEFRIPALHPGESRELEFMLRPVVPGCLSGRVADDRGRPVSGATILLRPTSPMQGYASATSKPDGTFTATRVDPGSYRVTAKKKSDGYIEDWEEAREVTIGSSSLCEEADLALAPKAAWIIIHLESARQQPTSGTVVLTQAETGMNRTQYIREKDPPPVAVPPNSLMILEILPQGTSGRQEPTTIPPLQPGQTVEVTLSSR